MRPKCHEEFQALRKTFVLDNVSNLVSKNVFHTCDYSMSILKSGIEQGHLF